MPRAWGADRRAEPMYHCNMSTNLEIGQQQCCGIVCIQFKLRANKTIQDLNCAFRQISLRLKKIAAQLLQCRRRKPRLLSHHPPSSGIRNVPQSVWPLTRRLVRGLYLGRAGSAASGMEIFTTASSICPTSREVVRGREV